MFGSKFVFGKNSQLFYTKIAHVEHTFRLKALLANILCEHHCRSSTVPKLEFPVSMIQLSY